MFELVLGVLVFVVAYVCLFLLKRLVLNIFVDVLFVIGCFVIVCVCVLFCVCCYWRLLILCSVFVCLFCSVVPVCFFVCVL